VTADSRDACARGSRPDPLEKHALRLLNSLQLGVRLEAQPLPERFGDDDAPGFIDLEFHTIYITIYH